MPAGYQKWPPYPGTYKPYTLANAERDRYIIALRCNGCRKTAYYLPSDLAKLLGPDRAANEPPPFPCSRCHTSEMLRVTLRSIADGDYGSLEVRRPGPVKHTQTWRTVKLGDDVQRATRTAVRRKSLTSWARR